MSARKRIGVEGKRIVGRAASGRPSGTRSRFGRRARHLLALIRPGKIRERIIQLILGNEYELFGDRSVPPPRRGSLLDV